jgi:hypothetical protein
VFLPRLSTAAIFFYLLFTTPVKINYEGMGVVDIFTGLAGHYKSERLFSVYLTFNIFNEHSVC